MPVKLGHISWSHVQKLGFGGSLGLSALDNSKPSAHPICSASQSGRLHHTAEPDRDRYTGSVIFCDAASGHTHQASLGTSDTIVAKENFERMALHAII